MNTPVLLLCPVFNEEQHLDALIASLKQQTWSDWILVLGDNASQDGSTEKIISASQNDKRIKAILYSDRLPVHDSFNRTFHDALESVRSDFVQIIAADDCFAGASSLHTLLSTAYSKSASLVAGNMVHYDDNGPLESNDFSFFEPIKHRSLRTFAMEKWGANLMYSLFNRDEFERLLSNPVSRFSSNLASDWWFSWVAINSIANPVFIQAVTYRKFRKSGGFSSPQARSNAFLTSVIVLKESQMRIGDRRGHLGKLRTASLFFWLLIGEVWAYKKKNRWTFRRGD